MTDSPPPPAMKRTLLLCFIHGFKGDAETFWDFPKDLQSRLQTSLPDSRVVLAVYPKYETKGDLSASTAAFLQWLKEKVVAVRREHCHTPWPPNDREVGVILVAHSMGGFVASDALFTILDDRYPPHSPSPSSSTTPPPIIFPYIRGILAFDTPYNGLARSMFVYGAFSQYQKVSSIWNVMSATSAGVMSARSMGGQSLGSLSSNLGRSAVSTSTSSALSTTGPTSGWRFWQNVAFKSGTVGAIAAGGVAAYRNREAIVRSIRNLNRASIKEGAENGYDALGQGLAYINRDSVGRSFAWLSSHLKFVGALMRQKELAARLERLANLEGVGVRSLYTSLGENGYWSGGYFVPERAFCAIPAADQKAYGLFTRSINTAVEDEVQAHMSMFKKQGNDHYEELTSVAEGLCVEWWESEKEVVDVPVKVEEVADTKAKTKTKTKEQEGESKKEEEGEHVETEKTTIEAQDTSKASPEEPSSTSTSEDPTSSFPLSTIAESPLDIAAAAAIPLPLSTPSSDADLLELHERQRQNYLANLLRLSQRAGSGLTSLPRSLLPSVSVPSGATMKNLVPDVGRYVPSKPNVSVGMPSVGMPKRVWPFGKREEREEGGEEEKKEEDANVKGEGEGEEKSGEVEMEEEAVEEEGEEAEEDEEVVIDEDDDVVGELKDVSGVKGVVKKVREAVGGG